LLRIQSCFAARFVLIALAPGVLLAAQSTSSAAPPLPLNDRIKTLNAIFSDQWEDRLKHEPEFASSIGDKRYNDQLSDLSVQNLNFFHEVLSR